MTAPYFDIPADALVISRHHEWAGGHAKDGESVVCLLCGVRVPIGQWPRKTCSRKFEHPRSGYGGIIVRDGSVIGRFNRVGQSAVRYRPMSDQQRRDAGNDA